MRITLFVYGTWGDLRPDVVLGMGLQAAGHVVQIVASPGYEAWVRARNLGFYPLTDDIQKLIAANSNRVSNNPVQQIQLMREVVSPALTRMGLDVLEATRDSDALMTVEFGVSLLLDVLQMNDLRTIIINPAPLTPTRKFASAAAPPMPGWFPLQKLYNRFSYTFVQRLQWWLLGRPRNELRKKHLGLPKSTFKDFQAALAAAPCMIG